MCFTIADLQVGQKAVISEKSTQHIPLKLMEMGCLPGIQVELIQKAPLNDPLYIKVNDSHLAIRVETATQIEVKIFTVD